MSMPKGNIRLKQPKDVRRLLARVINELLQQEPSSIERARVIATLSNSIIKAMEVGELDERIKEIEKQLGVEES
ncbi:hypothetical protein PNF30_16215 [Bacillus safensis]|uniref:hypothetical protein n=1 Tax=Bacillus TaxID=1386 RepID=UPI002342D72B|nr:MULTISPECIES: hypothetical protein [Bacillus]MEC3814155.1 hypothetical protein [Bacillus altitudinis]WCL57023.1 hypothetical protein PNF30_16215 [Bacillus safensis]